MANGLRRSNVLQNIKVGDTITAKLLNDIVKTVNSSSQNIAAPSNQPIIYGEISRTWETVTATDSNGDTVDFEQMRSVTFRTARGDIMSLVFNNPIIAP